MRALTLLTVGWALTVASAQANSIFVSDAGNNSVVAYDAQTGAFQRVVVPSASSPLNGAGGIRFRDGFLYVASSNSNSVEKFNAATGADLGAFVPSGSGGLNSPQDLTFAPNGDLLVVSSQNDEILEYNGKTGAFVGVFATVDQPSHNGPINALFGPDGDLYVTAFDGSRILKLSGTTGALLGTMLPPTDDPAYVGLAFGPGGLLYTSAISKVDFTGSVLRYDPSTLSFVDTVVPNGDGGLIAPAALAFDAQGRLEVLDPANEGILRYSADGTFLNTFVSDPAHLSAPLFFDTSTVPEPATIWLVACAGVLLMGLRAVRLKSRG